MLTMVYYRYFDSSHVGNWDCGSAQTADQNF